MNSRSKKSDEIADLKRSACPVANTLKIIGDKWTLVVVRDLFLGKKTYGELQQSPEGIPTNILADRLKRLEREGVLEKNAYQDNPVRYEYRLTEKGRDLRKVLKAVKEWGLKNIKGTNAQWAEEYFMQHKK